MEASPYRGDLSGIKVSSYFDAPPDSGTSRSVQAPLLLRSERAASADVSTPPTGKGSARSTASQTAPPGPAASAPRSARSARSQGYVCDYPYPLAVESSDLSIRSTSEYLMRYGAGPSDVTGIPSGLSSLRLKPDPSRSLPLKTSTMSPPRVAAAVKVHVIASPGSATTGATPNTSSSDAPMLARQGDRGENQRGVHRYRQGRQAVMSCDTPDKRPPPVLTRWRRQLARFNGAYSLAFALALTLVSTLGLIPLVMGTAFLWGSGWNVGCVISAVVAVVSTAAFCLAAFVFTDCDMSRPLALQALGWVAEVSMLLTFGWSALAALPYGSVRQLAAATLSVGLLYGLCRQIHVVSRDVRDDLTKALYATAAAIFWAECVLSLLAGAYLAQLWPSDHRAALAFVRMLLAALYYVWIVHCLVEPHAIIQLVYLGFYMWATLVGLRHLGTPAHPHLHMTTSDGRVLQHFWALAGACVCVIMLGTLLFKGLAQVLAARKAFAANAPKDPARSTDLPPKRLAARVDRTRASSREVCLQKMEQGEIRLSVGSGGGMIGTCACLQ